MNRVSQGGEVDPGERFQVSGLGAQRSFFGLRRSYEGGQIDTAEIAGFEGEEGLFAAGIDGFDTPQMGSCVILINSVDKSQTGFAGAMGVLDDQLPELLFRPEEVGIFGRDFRFIFIKPDFDKIVDLILPDIEAAGEIVLFLVAGIPDEVQRIGMIQELIHPFIGDLDRDVIIGEGVEILLGMEEF